MQWCVRVMFGLSTAAGVALGANPKANAETAHPSQAVDSRRLGSRTPRPSWHALGAGVDLGIQSVRDDALVPLVHTGPRVTAHAGYLGRLGVGLLQADARFGPAAIFGRYWEEGFTLHWSLRAALLFDVDRKGSTQFALGPALAWENDTFYFEDWDDAHAYWIGTRWLGPRLQASRPLNDTTRVNAQLEFAVVGLLSRPPGYRMQKQETSEAIGPILTWPSTDPKFATIADVQVVRATIDLTRTTVGAEVSHGFGYGLQMTFIRAAEPAPAVSFESALRMTYAWGL
jgi:hypothetical protein